MYVRWSTGLAPRHHEWCPGALPWLIKAHGAALCKTPSATLRCIQPSLERFSRCSIRVVNFYPDTFSIPVREFMVPFFPTLALERKLDPRRLQMQQQRDNSSM